MEVIMGWTCIMGGINGNCMQFDRKCFGMQLLGRQGLKVERKVRIFKFIKGKLFLILKTGLNCLSTVLSL
jgi:hypothetical protein